MLFSDFHLKLYNQIHVKFSMKDLSYSLVLKEFRKRVNYQNLHKLKYHTNIFFLLIIVK